VEASKEVDRKSIIEPMLFGSVNPLNKRKYGEGFYKLLCKRQELPSWDAKDKVIELVEEY